MGLPATCQSVQNGSPNRGNRYLTLDYPARSPKTDRSAWDSGNSLNAKVRLYTSPGYPSDVPCLGACSSALCQRRKHCSAPSAKPLIPDGFTPYNNADKRAGRSGTGTPAARPQRPTLVSLQRGDLLGAPTGRRPFRGPSEARPLAASATVLPRLDWRWANSEVLRAVRDRPAINQQLHAASSRQPTLQSFHSALCCDLCSTPGLHEPATPAFHLAASRPPRPACSPAARPGA